MPDEKLAELTKEEVVDRFAARLREFRHRLAESGSQRTLEEIGEHSGVARNTARAWIEGDRLPPSRDLAQTVALACGASHEEARAAGIAWTAANRELLRRRDESNRARQRSIRRMPEPGPGPIGATALPSSTDLLLGPNEETSVVTRYRNNSEFYRAALADAATAESVRVTYIRQHSPDYVTSEASSAYFAGLLQWARDDGAHDLRRIIGIPMTGDRHDPRILAWMRAHAQETADLRNYEVKVIPWMSRGDGLNMCLVDDRTSYVAVSDGTRQGLSGGRVQGPLFNGMLRTHFDQLWQCGEVFERFLESVPVTPSQSD
ncbi:helix-turn-helix transcriptional regulator [Kineosporia sp. J2-2]|uniref:Helix-turn-helix transcriptional regulator n=1 Tax=Kineosporia corallincola TaxID=2835133 RepID=A0ABS5TI20_9ACTN|nr:helix-turn-helix transcriptional regulator [Kineosporia corallincola]MBT0769841.1 helix-turn-helix transcriptional regulator [Kineosporia corallincola]